MDLQTQQYFKKLTRIIGPSCSVLNSFLDGFYAPLEGASADDITKVIGLINIREYDEARVELARLIVATIRAIPELGALDYGAITPAQAAIIAPRVNDIYGSIENALCKKILILVEYVVLHMCKFYAFQGKFSGFFDKMSSKVPVCNFELQIL